MAAHVSYSSNSFLLTTATRPGLLRSNNPRQLILCAKNGNGSPFYFGLGKAAGDEGSDNGAPRVNPFQINWGNLADVKSLVPVVSSSPALAGFGRQKDAGTIFVAGATGQAGVRIAQTLLRQGFKVRAGVPDLAAAQELARFALDYKIISAGELKRLNAVESAFEDTESIAKAIGNASKVVVTVGISENGPAKEVTLSDALQVVEAAQLAGVRHLTVIYDDSAAVPSANSVLEGISSFFNNLFSKSQLLTVPEFLDRLIQTDVKYTFIKTALADDFSSDSSYNVFVAAEGRVADNDYKVGRSKMAALVADLFSNTEVAEDKVVEVYADPSAASKSIVQLFSVIAADGRRQAYAEAVAKAEAEKAAGLAREADERKKQVEEEVKKLSEQETQAGSLPEEAKQKAEDAGASVESLLSKAKDLGSGLSWEKLGSQFTSAVNVPNLEIPKVQIATVRGQAKARSLAPQKAVIKQMNSKPKPKPKPKEVSSKREVTEKAKGEESKKEVRNILGGLFKQETVYVDDD